MPRRSIGANVFDAAIDRMVAVYEQGHRVVVSVSTGKDSTCALEVCRIAARLTDRLPVEAVIRDEEILYPGSYEYSDRIHDDPEIELHHLVARQPIINAFDRERPYWWVFDPLVPEDEWVRKPPPYAEWIDDLNIEAMTTKARFPVDEDAGQQLVAVIGLRVYESRGRLYGLHSSGGYLTKPIALTGVVNARPIYDWKDTDVWRAIEINGWDYNDAYDVMHRMGVSMAKLRIGPPSMNAAAIDLLRQMTPAWPQWWDRVQDRLPSLRSAVHYGKRVLEPTRRLGESWRDTFQRECIDQAPTWIAERAQQAADRITLTHSRHSTTPLPEVSPCHTCHGNNGSWKALALNLYLGDPFAQKLNGMLKIVEPEFFRPGAGVWGGAPG